MKEPKLIATSRLFVPLGPIARILAYSKSEVNRREAPGVVG